MENATDLPSLATFVEIFNSASETWFTCRPWAIVTWAVEFLFYMSMSFLFFYLYVLSIILYNRLFKSHFRGSFYNCVLLLSLGDMGILLVCSRATIPPCALGTFAARYLAWESLSVFCVDLIYGVNLVIAAVRLNAVLGLFTAGSKKSSKYILNGFLLLEFAWALTMGVLYFNGYIKRIWFEGSNYKQVFLFPFDYFRTPFNMAQLGVTFLLYCVAFVKLRQVSLSAKTRSQQNRFMLLAILIFLCELLFIYSSDWVGYSWGIGDEIFNAHVSYFGRPLATGITPVLYILFSSEVRQACGFGCCQGKYKEQNVTSTAQDTGTWTRKSFLFITVKRKG